MKYILVEIPNEVSEIQVEHFAEVFNELIKVNNVDNVTVRFGSLFTSL